MNEAELLIYLLTRIQDNIIIGTKEQDLLKILALTDKNAKSKLLNLLQELNMNLSILGLIVKFNSANEHWFIGFKDEMPNISYKISDTGLSSSSAATLLSILVISISDGSPITYNDLMKIRKKKSLKDDLFKLEAKGFIKTSKGNLVLTPKIFYYIDLEKIIDEIKELNQNRLKDKNP